MFFRELAHEGGIVDREQSPQLVVEMTKHQFVRAGFEEGMEERDGIPAS